MLASFLLLLHLLSLHAVASPTRQTHDSPNVASPNDSQQPLPDLTQDAMRVLLQNEHAHQLSIRDLVDLSRVDRELRDWMKTQPSWKYLQVLQNEPCYSGFSENAYYIPSTRHPVYSHHNDNQGRRDSLRFVFDRWIWDKEKLDGKWWDGVKHLTFLPDFTPQRNFVACLGRLLDSNLEFEVQVDTTSRPPTWHSPLGDWGRQEIEMEPLDVVKEWLLWVAINGSNSRVIDYLLSPTQNTPISSRHFQLAGQMKNEQIYQQLIDARLERNNAIPWDNIQLCHLFEHFDPTSQLIDNVLEAARVSLSDIRCAARFGRTRSLRHLLSRASQNELEWITLEIALDNALDTAAMSCQTEILDMLLHEYHMEPEEYLRRQIFVCAVLKKEKPRKLAKYFRRFKLREDFELWRVYLARDELPSSHITNLLNIPFNTYNKITLKKIMEDLLSWPEVDIRSFIDVNLLIEDDAEELDFEAEDTLFFTALKRSNVNKAREYLQRFGMLNVGPSMMSLWLRKRLSGTKELELFLQLTKAQIFTDDIEELVQSADDKTIELAAWLIENVTTWNRDNLEYFDELARECGPTWRKRLQSAIDSARERLSDVSSRISYQFHRTNL